ncbi:MAG: hypothetical protein JNM43_14815 [Planctomycetaceae bacterium]|nr:hypothetical protein [Planctomycetaceae bacterium]
MESENESPRDVEQLIQELNDRITDADQKLLSRTGMRLNSELRRLAQDEKRLGTYLVSVRRLSEAGLHFTPQNSIDLTVRLIAMLEDENLARTIQPDITIDEFEFWQHRLTPSAYHNLASQMGQVHGYNSKSMHQCIADGLNVSRKFGDNHSIMHFREFAVEVYRAADDLDMALHFARGSLNLEEDLNVGRRVASADDVASMLALQGRLEEAADAVMEGWQYVAEFHNPYNAETMYSAMARSILNVAGRTDLLASFPGLDASQQDAVHCGRILEYPPIEEGPRYTYVRDRAIAIEDCCHERFEEAIRRMTPWDKRLMDLGLLDAWFSTRLLLIAAFRMSGKTNRLEALAAPLREKASKADDWLTLHRLERLLDPSIRPTPGALCGDVSTGPFASIPRRAERLDLDKLHERLAAAGQEDESSETPSEESEVNAEAVAAEGAEQGSESGDPSQPVSSSPRMLKIVEKIMEADGDVDKLGDVVDAILAMPASSLTPEEADEAFRMLRYSLQSIADWKSVWRWAEAVASEHRQSPDVLSLLGSLGGDLRFAVLSRIEPSPSEEMPDDAEGERAVEDPEEAAALAALKEELDQILPPARMESLFLEAMDIAPNHAPSFGRAGLYYLEQEKMGEAERFLARSFRLDRTQRMVAYHLSDLYSRTDRRIDSLAVLDLAIREGCHDAALTWQAALCAYSLERYPVMLTYLNHFELLAPNQPETNHYRACALLELRRPTEALKAIEAERAINPDMAFACDLQEATAWGQMLETEKFEERLRQILATKFSTVEGLTNGGISRLMNMVWSASPLDEEDPLQQQFDQRMMECAFAGDGLLTRFREANPSKVKVELFHCFVKQPLGEGWAESHACLPGEQEWTAYVRLWGILAEDADAAAETALLWQKRCWPESAEVQEVSATGDSYTDTPGVVFIGRRIPV